LQDHVETGAQGQVVTHEQGDSYQVLKVSGIFSHCFIDVSLPEQPFDVRELEALPKYRQGQDSNEHRANEDRAKRSLVSDYKLGISDKHLPELGPGAGVSILSELLEISVHGRVPIGAFIHFMSDLLILSYLIPIDHLGEAQVHLDSLGSLGHLNNQVGWVLEVPEGNAELRRQVVRYLGNWTLVQAMAFVEQHQSVEHVE